MFLRRAMMAAGAAAPVAYATFSAAHKGPQVSLSEGSLSATRTGGANLYQSVRSTIPVSGKSYFELYMGMHTTGSTTGVGIDQDGLALNSGSAYVGGRPNGVGLWGPNKEVYRADTALVARPYDGNILARFAFDASTGELWVGDTIEGWYTGDPSTGVDPITTLPVDSEYYVYASLSALSPTFVLANFGASEFEGAVPAGFKAGVYS